MVQTIWWHLWRGRFRQLINVFFELQKFNSGLLFYAAAVFT
jgi:hypothetical protein